jgi:hypothetical protein
MQRNNAGLKKLSRVLSEQISDSSAFLYAMCVLKKYVLNCVKPRRMRWAEHVARMGRRGMHIGHRWEVQKERDQWEDQDVGGWTIKMDLRERGWGGMDWIDLAQNRNQ